MQHRTRLLEIELRHLPRQRLELATQCGTQQPAMLLE
jgi:hypothetical protein